MKPGAGRQMVCTVRGTCGTVLGVRGGKVVGNVVMRRGTRALVACAVGLMLVWAPMAGVWAQSPSLGDSGEASTFVPAERLADPAGWADELAARRRELEAVSAQAAAGLERAQAQLALANWILAVPTACAATRSLLGLELPSDAKTLADGGQEAQRLIEQAREAMEVAKSESDAVSAGPDGEEAAAARRRLETALENLEPLAALFATAAEADEDGGRAMWSRAARGLAVLREAADAELASCAMLWQAYAWLEAGRQDRARALLPRPLRQPDATAYGFMSRLLGCRMLGDEGQYTAASALAIRVRAACAGWFQHESAMQIGARQRLAALLQISLGQQWLRQLRESDQPARVAQLEKILEEVRESLFTESSLEIHRLSHTVPLMVQPPTLKPRVESLIPRREPVTPAATAPASEPADVPAPADEPAATSVPADGA